MKRYVAIITFFLTVLTDLSAYACSTFMFSRGDELIIGHNTDDFIELPGLVVINKRGVEKYNISVDELFWGRKKSNIKVKWVSKYGSVTYNFFGMEFCDGGMNEAGLYVGEMTLLSTRYPKNKSLPKFGHAQWMQYLLDNFASVDEVIESVSGVTLDGSCKWHYFIADRSGNSATIEFLEGKPVIHSGKDMPVKVLCNSIYSKEIKKLKRYKGFGGKKEIDLVRRKGDDRFLWAALMIEQYDGNDQCKTILDHGWDILEQLSQLSSTAKDASVNKWRIIYDLKNERLYFRTNLARRVRYIDFSSFDFSRNSPAMLLDINEDLSGEVSKYFSVYSPLENKKHIKQVFKIITNEMGVIERVIGILFVPSIKRRMNNWTNDFSCQTDDKTRK